MLYFMMQKHSAAAKVMRLMNKRTGMYQEFPHHREPDIYFSRCPAVAEFDMSKLEKEYDYDTDTNQQDHSRNMLKKELEQAIEFYVKEDPLKLVDNVNMR